MMAKYFATSLAMEKVVSAPRVISNCFPISTISISLVGFEVEIDHVAGLARRLRAGVHGDAHVSLGQGRCVVGAVTAHGDKLALRLLIANEAQLVLGCGLGKEVVDAGLRRNRSRRHRIVAGDHDRADAHASQLGEALADAAFDDVLEVNHAEELAILGDGERCAARLRDRIGDGIDLAHGLRADRRLKCLGGRA